MVTVSTPYALGTPCWVDLNTSDPDDARSFYAELFGWRIEKGPEEMGYYSRAQLADSDVAGINGMVITDHPPVWATHLAVDDLASSVDEAVRAGGTVIAPPVDVMDLGKMAILQDPTKGAFGMWQSGTFFGATRVNEPNTLVWNELMTRDYAAAKEFYAAVFGYTYDEIGDGGFEYSTVAVNGRTIGGLGVLPPDVPEQVPAHWRVYFAVDDADAAVDKAVQLGGTVLSPPQDMPYGRHADLADRQGAMFAVIASAGSEPESS